jgi:hypothetical protein
MNSKINEDNSKFLREAYETILGRAPDEVGFSNYLTRLTNGTPRFRVILELITSSEAKFRAFDATGIEDIINYYLISNKKFIRVNADKIIGTKYSGRIFDFFYKLRYANKSENLKSIEEKHGDTKSINNCSIIKNYESTLICAEEILKKLYENRRRNQGSIGINDVLGIHVPRWAGVTNSTKSFFPNTFPIPLTKDEAPEQLNEEQIKALTDALAESEFTQLVFSGGDHVQYRIAKAIKEKTPKKRIKVIWHGSPRQLGPHYELDPFLSWVHAARTGICEKIGTVKPGMTRLLDALGIRNSFLQNAVNFNSSTASTSVRQNTIGMWLSHVGNYNKPTAPTLFALARLQNLSLQGAGFGSDGIELIQRLKIAHKSISPSTVSHTQVIEGMRSSKLTIYITLSECMPMIPFESIGEGAPCLVGPATKLYDDPFLEDHLMVSNPFDPIEISQKIDWAIAHYDDLKNASYDFLLRCKSRQTKNLAEFLE